MRFLLVLFLAFFLPALAFAGTLEEADAAFQVEDYQTAINIWQTLAEQGNLEAQNRLGGTYVYGDHVKQNLELGKKWIQNSANQGYWAAQSTFAEMYFNGLAVGKCYEEAYFWDLLSKNSNIIPLPIIPWSGADYYLTSEQKADVEKRALEWNLKASKHGIALAQFSLGRMYLNGYVVKENYEEAYFWGLLAKKSTQNMKIKGLQYALSLLIDRATDQHLTSEQKSLIEKRVAEWKPIPATTKAETK